MSHLLYFVVIAATMMGLARVLPGFIVADWVAALIAAVVLALVNAIVRPILFVLTLPFTIVTLGLFLLVLNALMVWLTALLVPGFDVRDAWTTFLASLALSLVGMVWNGLTRGRDRSRDDD
jgi:putative membrane protein